MTSNFMFTDIVGISLALALFSLVFMFPGFAIGWSADLFHFRQRATDTQFAMSVFISASVMPSILFLVYRFASFGFTAGALILFSTAATALYCKQIRNRHARHPQTEYSKLVLALTLLWVIFSVFLLMDLQVGNRLYFGNNSYDLLTRVSVVDAMTRSGVPPVNPSYYPGHEVRLDFLYYYWYILASVVDQFGGTLVSAFHAMIASISWCGIALIATVASYLQIRLASERTWKTVLIAIQLLAISGLDCIIVVLTAVKVGHLPPFGGIEGWNMPIMSWLNAVTWVPHHVTAAIACIFALSILMHEKNKRPVDKLLVSAVIGLAFSSAFGLSVWVMFVFAFFWAVWAVFTLVQKDYASLSVMASGGLFALIFVFPFLAGLTAGSGGGGSGGSALPVAFYIRPFMASIAFPEGTSPTILNIANFVMLPLNYLFELGFFFIMAALWIQEVYVGNKDTHLIYKAELVLVTVITIVLSFLYSNIIAINDLGIRGWLPMQIILITWSADLIVHFIGDKKWVTPGIFRVFKSPKSLGPVLGITMILGLLTTGLEAVSLRAWPIFIDMGVVGFPNPISVDNHLGERTYYARLAYKYIDENTPSSIVIQSNPLDQFDRPGGLYGTRQMVISDRTIYGVPASIYEELSEDIGAIFAQQTDNWESIDAKCDQYLIDILVIKDTDRLWSSLSTLKAARPPIYENPYYALYSCGK